jgi:predicted negative regulator of RcsB-dependent stress response
MAFDDLMSDDETAEQLRNWWRSNWAWLLSGVALGLVILFGWMYWTKQQTVDAEQAAQIYRQLVAASDRNDFPTMERLHEQLGKDHDSTPYADQSSLLLARMYVETGEYDKAVTQLRDVMDNAKDKELAAIAKLRLARVLIQQDKPDEALALVTAEAGAFGGFEQEIRGDALVAKGDLEGARNAYASALTAQAGLANADQELIRLKMQDLQAEAAPAPAAPTEQAAP